MANELVELLAGLEKVRAAALAPESTGVIAKLEDCVAELAQLEHWEIPGRTQVEEIARTPGMAEEAVSSTQGLSRSHSQDRPDAEPEPSHDAPNGTTQVTSTPKQTIDATSTFVSASLTLLAHILIVATVLILQRASFVEFGSIPALNLCFCHLGMVSAPPAIAAARRCLHHPNPRLLPAQVEVGWGPTSRTFRVGKLKLFWWKLNAIAKGLLVAVHYFALGVILFSQTQQKACSACSSVGVNCTAYAALPDGCVWLDATGSAVQARRP